MTEYIINPNTSRPVAVGSRTYNNLVKDGVIQGEAPALKKHSKDFDTTFSKSGKKQNKTAPKKTIKKTKKQVVYESEEDDEFESEPAPLVRTKSMKSTKKKESVNIPMDEYKILLNMMNKNKQDEYEYSEDESDYSEDDE